MFPLKFDQLVQRLISGGFAALLAKVLSAGLSYAMLVVLARLLMPAEYGRFAFGFSLATTLSVLPCLGLPVAGLRFWPEYKVQNQPGLGRAFMAWSFLIVIASSTGFAVLLTVVAMSTTSDVQGYGLAYFAAIAGLMALMAVSEHTASALRADGAVAFALLPRDVIWRALVIALAMAIALSGIEPGAELALQLVTGTLALIAIPQLIYCWRRLHVSITDLAADKQLANWIRVSMPMWGAAIVFIMARQFDVVILGFFLSPEHIGPYFAAQRTASLISLLPMAAGMVAAPMISEFYHSGDHDSLRKLTSVMMLGIALPTLVGFAVLAVLGPWLLSLFDETFVSAYPFLLILGFGYTVLALSGPVAYFLQMVGRERDFLKITVGVYICVILLQYACVPILGEYGAAIPGTAGLCATAVWSILYLRRRVGFDPSLAGLIWPVRRVNS